MENERDNNIVVAIKTAVRNYINRQVAAGKKRDRIWRLAMPFWYGDKYWIAMCFNVRWKRDVWKCGHASCSETDSDTYWRLVDQMNAEFKNEKIAKNEG